MKRAAWIAALLLVALASFWAGRHSAESELPTTGDTVTVVYDTVRCYVPIARDSVVVRYVTRALPVAKSDPTDLTDSVAVVVPVESRVYEDSLYTAYVSGYEPRLDSIFIRERHILTTTTVTVRQTKRWSVGPCIGVGIAPCGRFEPSIGVSVQYALFNF
jgi:hypothetical protein